VISEKDYSSSDREKISKFTIFGGKSYTQVKNPDEIVNELFKNYKNAIEKFYKVEAETSDELIEKIGQKKNFLKKGGLVNEDKTAREILRAWQKGEIKN
jgi:ribosome biogenesis GTPase A